ARLHEVKDAKLYHPRLAASRAGDDEDRSINSSDCLVLPVVELASYLFLHLIGSTLIEYNIEGGGFSGHIRIGECMYYPGGIDRLRNLHLRVLASGPFLWSRNA